MNYFEALYGSQHRDVLKNGGDPNKGRLNGNLFFSAFIIILLFLVIAIVFSFSENAADVMTKLLRNIFGRTAGKTIGRLVAIPLMGIIYLVIANTVGSKANYKKCVANFLTYPEAVTDTANKRILRPFILVLAFLMIFMFKTLF